MTHNLLHILFFTRALPVHLAVQRISLQDLSWQKYDTILPSGGSPVDPVSKVPQGQQSNWLPTDPKRRFLLLARFYGSERVLPRETGHVHLAFETNREFLTIS